jgi:putative membrane protein
MKHVKALLIVLFVLLIIILAVENDAPMSTPVTFRIDLLFLEYKTAEMSLYVVVVVAFLVGIVFAGLYGMMERFRLRREIKTLEKEAGERERELNSLRNLPVTAEDVHTE